MWVVINIQTSERVTDSTHEIHRGDLPRFSSFVKSSVYLKFLPLGGRYDWLQVHTDHPYSEDQPNTFAKTYVYFVNTNNFAKTYVCFVISLIDLRQSMAICKLDATIAQLSK